MRNLYDDIETEINSRLELYLAQDLKASTECLALIRSFEGLSRTAYRDSVGVWTIGYGRTRGVKSGDTVTMDQAESNLLLDVQEHADGVREACEDVQLTQFEFDALVSWTFNLGIGSLESSTLLKRLRGGAHDEVAYEMMRWAYAAGTWLRGLAKRRHAEALMFLGNEWQDHYQWKGFNKRRYKKWLSNHRFDLYEGNALP